MMIKSTPFCLMPWVHLHSGLKGKVSACCVANIPLGNINHHSKEEIWNGEKINQLREKFATGESDKRCSVCLNLEATGAKSIRQETMDKFSDLDLTEVSWPVYYDIRFSNHCNLACTTCWHGASSSWFKKAKASGTNISDKALIQNVSNWKVFIDRWGEGLINAKEIYLAGGEPLLMEEHYQLLDFLIENGNTDVHLRYNSNFTRLNFKDKSVLDYWKQFSRVEVLASLDMDRSLGEEIREGLNWQRIEENRNELRQVKHLSFKISPTISSLNVLYLKDYFIRLIENDFIGPNDFYINILDRPLEYNIQSLSDSDKEKAHSSLSELIQYLADKGAEKETLRSIQDIIGHLDQ